MPGAIVESLGIGMALAGWAEGQSIQDNSVQAVGRWAQAYSRALFPGDPLRADDFATKLANGIGSTAGFWGVNAAAIAAKIGKPGSAGLVATIGALSQANQPWDEAMAARKKGKDVDDLQLALLFAGGMLLGATEAAPIASNLKGVSVQTRNKYLAFAAAASCAAPRTTSEGSSSSSTSFGASAVTCR
jgi:hypothetical protein